MTHLCKLVSSLLVELSHNNIPGMQAVETSINEFLAENQAKLGSDTVIKVLLLIYLKNKFQISQ